MYYEKLNKNHQLVACHFDARNWWEKTVKNKIQENKY